MPSETDLVNVALRHIGAGRITSLNDGSAEANAANDIYTAVRDGLLAKHNWNYATKRVQLARSSTTPSFGFSYGYVLPSDWVKTVSVHDNDAGVSSITFRHETNGTEQVLLADSENVYLRYIARITDPNMMPADFRTALQFALARDLAVPIANSNTLRDQMNDEAKRSLAFAKSADAMGSSPEPRARGSWVTSRGGWGGSSFADR